MTSEQEIESKFEQSGLPALYYAADTLSLRSQQVYLRLFLVVLVLTVAAPAAIVLGAYFPYISQPMRFIAAAGLIVALVLTGRIKETQKERSWYGARAVAESVKTTAWRFAMGAEPFPKSMSDADAEVSFKTKLSEILQGRKSLNYSAAGDENRKAEITDQMRAIRQFPLERRITLYSQQRVQNQRDWYSGKARLSEEKEALYFWSILACQLISVIVAGIFAAVPSLHVNITAIFTAATASLLAWLQVKRYQETSQSYAVAAQDLGIIQAGATNVRSEEQFAAFVADAENAMSREHTLWVARRDAR